MIGDKKIYIISSIFLAIAASLCLFVSIQVISKGYVNIGGYSLFRVVTGSMEPTISKGSLLLCKETKVDQIEVGDIVCYRTKISEIYGSIVTHRVVDKQKDESGNIYLETRGDANASSDPYYVDSWDLVGRVKWHSGEENVMNDMLSFLTSKIGFITCIALPVLLISGVIMQSAVRNLQEELALAKSELEQEEMMNEQSELLPGYTTLTYADYEILYETLKRELLEELNGRNQGTES